MESNQLIPHLFRTEFSKIVSVLCKTYGFSNIQWAEDIVSDTFLTATETWRLKGFPENATAWLYRVAKNKAIDQLRRDNNFQQKIQPDLQKKETTEELQEIDLSDHNIQDSQLRMFFAICNPVIKPKAQIALALRILCGFNAQEIANAFLSNKETINKRIHRAKATIKKEQIQFDLPSPSEIRERLEEVISILYLLFNEGYYSTSTDKNLRKELCVEAMRLNLLLLDSPLTNTPELNALMALFCFHASRFEARSDKSGKQILYHEQDRSLWDGELIQKGEYFLGQSHSSQKVGKIHLEALIAFWHAQTTDLENKWENILSAYNQLLQLEYSPVVALNRTYALAKVKGNEVAIEEALKIDLSDHHLFHMLLAELYTPNNKIKAESHFKQALELVKNENEKLFILKKLEDLTSQD